MYGKMKEFLQKELADIREAGLYKEERIIASPQRAEIEVGGKKVLNFCANNYLGLSDNPRLVEAAKKEMDARGYGMSSVRFICGTQDIHKELEAAITEYFGTEDTILYAACFDANGGVFEPLFTDQDAIISDSLNHASIIDGVRLCKAVRYRYANADMEDLEKQLKLAQAQRFRIIVTDGVFSMDGNVAPMDKITELANKYDALVMVDECHSAGVVGKTGRGVTELYNIRGQVDIITGTLGKAFGGAIGGFTTGRKEIIELLRQRSRPYLFSNSVPPAVVGASLEVFRMLKESDERRRVRHQTHAVGHLRRDALRRPLVAGLREKTPRRGHLRDGLLLPGRSEGTGTYPGTGFRRTYEGPSRQVRRSLHQNRQGARSAQIGPGGQRRQRSFPPRTLRAGMIFQHGHPAWRTFCTFPS